MPVTAQIGRQRRNDDEMPDSGLDPRFTSGADVRLTGLIGLDRMNEVIPKASIVEERFDLHGGKVVEQ